MKLYLSIIGIGTFLIAMLTGIFHAAIGISVWFAIFATVISVLGCIAIDAVVALVARAFPRRHYSPYRKFFASKSWERGFYEKLGIRLWKDKIPEMGKLLVKFGKTKVEQKNNPEYLYIFLTELGYAEVMHWISAFAGFLVIFILPLEYLLFFGIPSAIVNFFLQIMPAMVQRYNRPRLVLLYERITARLRNETQITNDEL